MPRYFLGMYQPEGVEPPAEVLEPVMRGMGTLMGEAAATTGLSIEVRLFADQG